jgi:murein DD-endopeptidase MepM/ murein hydrolase activator NlpD
MSGIRNDILDSSQNAFNSNEFVNNQIEESSVSENLEIESTDSIQGENIGGENPGANTEEKIELTQMEQDAKDILDFKMLIIPLKGTITSRFGLRNPETPTVPKNHTGIDIAANEGTVFVAAMSGVVEKVSNEGDLGNHFKISNDDVSTVYAHCKTIYVKQGDKVIQGQEIGEVGSTGNSTGPHLHFEIRKNNRYVDPDLLLKF